MLVPGALAHALLGAAFLLVPLPRHTLKKSEVVQGLAKPNEACVSRTGHRRSTIIKMCTRPQNVEDFEHPLRDPSEQLQRRFVPTPSGPST